jgi:hypothetical protein
MHNQDRAKEWVSFYKFLFAIAFAILSSCIGFLISSYNAENLLSFATILPAILSGSIIFILAFRIVQLIKSL